MAVVAVLTAGGEAIATPGAITQKPGHAGCVSDNGVLGACSDDNVIDEALAITRDGSNLYSAGRFGISIFDRDTGSGQLSQRPLPAGCISNDDFFFSRCQHSVPGTGFESIALSPDDSTLYAVGDNLIAVFDRDEATGELAQLPGAAGCISTAGADEGCTSGRALDGAADVVVSPDGSNIYVAAMGSHAIAAFDRNTETGALTQKAGAAGCFAAASSSDGCAVANPLNSARTLAISPDGADLYVGATSSLDAGTSRNPAVIAAFARDASSGALAFASKGTGCLSGSPKPGKPCGSGEPFGSVSSVAIAPGGENVYVTAPAGPAGHGNGAIVTFDRNASSGALTQKPGSEGCTAESPRNRCADGKVLDGLGEIALTNDGQSAYVTSFLDDGVAVFDRDRGTGILTQKDRGPEGCVSSFAEFPVDGVCVEARAMQGPSGVIADPGSTNVYVSSADYRTVSVFDREETTFILNSPPSPTANDTLSFSFDSTRPADSFECRFDNEPFGPCSGGKLHTEELDDGLHSFGVRAVSGSVPDSTPAIRNVIVDTAPPETSIGRGPIRSESDGIYFEVSADEPRSVIACQIDDRQAFPAESTDPARCYLPESIQNGPHTLEATATDAAGNVDPTPASNGFTLDDPRPNLEITGKPPESIKTSQRKVTLTFRFLAEEGATATCRVDEGVRRSCDSPFQPTVRARRKPTTYQFAISATNKFDRTRTRRASVEVERVR